MHTTKGRLLASPEGFEPELRAREIGNLVQAIGELGISPGGAQDAPAGR